ncbi:MAG: hypothetical protein M3O09_03260 [Acidobacteriota bacterium]|nr:hypothetical protein [Acidobacteriota bacterium]
MYYAAPKFDLHQFGKRSRAVSSTSGITYSDYQRMHIQSVKKQRERRLLTPEWAASNDGILETAITLCERRYFGVGAFLFDNSGLSFEQRMERIRTKEIAVENEYRVRLAALIKRYSQEMKERASPERLAKVHTQIKNMDRQVMVLRRGAVAVTVSVAYLYYRNGWPSTEVAQHLGGLTPTGVRQLLARLNMAHTGVVYTWPKYEKWKKERTERVRIKAEHRAKYLAEIARLQSLVNSKRVRILESAVNRLTLRQKQVAERHQKIEKVTVVFPKRKCQRWTLDRIKVLLLMKLGGSSWASIAKVLGLKHAFTARDCYRFFIVKGNLPTA